MLEELDVALPDEILGRPSSLRGRRPVLQDTASSVDRLEAGEDGARSGAPLRRRARRRSIPSSAVTYARCTQKMSSKMALFVSRIVFTSSISSSSLATQAVRDVHVAGAIGVQPERKEGEPDVVRRERGHPGPLEARGQELVDPGVARRDLQVAVERAGLVGQETVGQRLPPRDRVRRPVPEDELAWLRDELVGGDHVDHPVLGRRRPRMRGHVSHLTMLCACAPRSPPSGADALIWARGPPRHPRRPRSARCRRRWASRSRDGVRLGTRAKHMIAPDRWVLMIKRARTTAGAAVTPKYGGTRREALRGLLALRARGRRNRLRRCRSEEAR